MENRSRGRVDRARREFLRAAATGLGSLATLQGSPGLAAEREFLCRDDRPVDHATALLYSLEAPLVPAPRKRDARAVWSRVPADPQRSVLIYLHGHNGYVTVDAEGASVVPDWASDDEKARKEASSKPAAPLIYRLDRVGSEARALRPVVLVPEVSTLATGSFWAREPAGQYSDPTRLGKLVTDCLKHLACLRRPDGRTYLDPGFVERGDPAHLTRVFLSGHSGAGLPLEEAAGSSLVLPGTGSPTDLWLFDCTYWSNVGNFVRFCARWNAVRRLAGGRGDASRFVCVYRARSATETVADDLRRKIAGVLGVSTDSLVKDHDADNFEVEVRPVLAASGVIFLRTHVAHDAIPTVLIPALLGSSAR